MGLCPRRSASGQQRGIGAVLPLFPDRRGEQTKEHIKNFHGVLHADAYAGFNQLYADGRIELDNNAAERALRAVVRTS